MQFSATPQAASVDDDRGLQSRSVGGVAVTASDSMPCMVQDVGPVMLLGDVFDAAGETVTALTRGQAHAIVASRGEWLVRNVWGRYVAFWEDPHGGGPWVMRDPSGAVPVYCLDLNGCWTLFSDLGALGTHSRRALACHRSALAHRLAYPGLITRQTPLADIVEIMPGEAMQLDGRRHVTQLWSPWIFAAGERAGRIASVRQAVDRAVASLSRRHETFVLELSGGLDSSILAGCLSAAGRNWRAATLVTPGADGDERRYARSVTDRYDRPLDELHIAADQLNLTEPPIRPGVRPSGYAGLAPVDRAFRERADRSGAILVSGTGGDNVFCALRSAAPLLDRLADEGPRAAIGTLRDLSRLTQVSARQTVGASLRYWRADRARPVRWRQDVSFLLPDAVPPLAPHPWLSRPAGSRPGTRAHVVAILRAQSVVATLERAQDGRMLFPLLAQPVVEACLAIPSWRWVEGGVDRAVARRAFADRLPAEVRERRSKGRLTSLLAPAFDRQRHAIADLLGDGELTRMGLIDRDLVTRAMSAPARYDEITYTRLLDLADAELWARAIAQTRSNQGG